MIKQEYYSADASKSEKIEYVYDSMDQLLQTKEYRTTNGVLTPYFTTNTYTKFGELASVQDPTGYTILYQYDDMGNKIHADYGDQNEIEYEYDKNDQLVQVSYSTRSLDLYNQFTKVETYEYYRDGKLRLYVPKQPANSSSETKKVYYYYQEDQLSSKVTTLSQMINDQEVISAQDTVNYLYDQSGQLTELSDKLGKTLYYYDESSNLTQQIRVDQLVTYDNDHNELTRIDQTSQTVGYSYDSYHNQTAIIYPDNTSVVYEYDELQRLSSVIDQNGTTTYTYDSVDNEVTKTLASSETTVTTYQLGKVTRKLTTYFDYQLNTLVTLVDQSITYDETGNVLTDTLIKNGVTTTTLNTYDERSQLLSSIKTEGTDKVAYNYVIDPFGNKNEVIKYYENDILTNSNTKSYTYNHLNQLASATIDSVLVNYVYDPYGNLVSEDDGTTEITYTYDLDNNLIAYDDETSYQFSYDGSGKRLSKRVDTIEVRYVNDASKANEQVLTYTVSNTTYKLTYGLNRIYEDNEAYIYDSYGNVIIHNDKQYAYSPYGSLSEGMIDGYNEYGYKGEVHDNQSLQYLRARYYHTELTQFISIDTYQGSDRNPLSQNRYSFVSNNPYKYSDPSGHFIISLEGYKVYIAGSAAQRQASTSSSTVPTIDKPLTENQINDIIDSYNPGPSNTNLAWRFLVQEKLQADYLAQQKAIEDAIPKGAKIAHEEFNRTVTQEAYDDYLEQVRQNAKTNEEGILSKIGNFVTGFVKNVVDSSINAFKDFATSTYDFFTDLKNYNLESFVDYIDDNLLNIGIMAGTVASLALLAVSVIGLLGASSAIMSTAMLVAGNISSIAGLAMGITGGLQVITGLNGTTLGGDELTNSERAGRLLSGTLNIFGGSGLMKTGIKLTGTDKNVVSKLINNVKESLFEGKSNLHGFNRPDFYVTPNGTVVPSNGYRYFARNLEILQSAKDGLLPARPAGTYFTFDKIDDAIVAQGKLQIPYRPEYRITFDTLQIIDDIHIPKGDWGKAIYLEPLTKSYLQYGPGKATQVITYSPINILDIYKLR